MRKRLLVLLLLGATILTAPSAWGAAIWSVDASSSDGSPLNSATPGARIFLDISLRTTDDAIRVQGSVNDYDNRFIQLNADESLISGSVLNQLCIPGADCFGGLVNNVGGGTATHHSKSVPSVLASKRIF